jgi:hypothetical protein
MTATVAAIASIGFVNKPKLTSPAARAGGGDINLSAAEAEVKAPLRTVLPPVSFDTAAAGLPWADTTRMDTGYDGLAGFETFPFEYNLFITWGEPYKAPVSYDTVSDTVAGGGAADPDGAALRQLGRTSIGSSYLSRLLAMGGTNAATQAADDKWLQNAILFLEDQRTLTDAGGYSNEFLGVAIPTLNRGADAEVTGFLGDVGAINLASDAGGAEQKIIRVPDGGITSLLLVLGLSGLALLRHQRG